VNGLFIGDFNSVHTMPNENSRQFGQIFVFIVFSHYKNLELNVQLYRHTGKLNA